MPDRNVFRGHGAAAAVFQQKIGDQVLVAVPPFGFLRFGLEFRCVHHYQTLIKTLLHEALKKESRIA